MAANGATGQPASADPEPAHLEVAPSVVFQLGQDLISNDIQALLELVKNAYDADSPIARVSVETSVFTDLAGNEVDPSVESDDPDGESPDDQQPGVGDDKGDESGETAPAAVALRGRLRITDRGTGMTEERIRSGWLTVSNSWKRELKAAGGTTGKKRTPLGDKGLGRLGAQRLGRILEIETQAANAPRYKVRLDWQEFEAATTLSQVDIPIVSCPAGREGTTITVRGLHDLERWERASATELSRELSRLLSPFGSGRGFDVTLTVDNEPIDLRKLPEKLLGSADADYTFTYEGGRLTIEARFSREFFGDKKLGVDIAREFRTWLLAQDDIVRAFDLRAGTGRWLFTSARTVALAELDKVSLDHGGQPADPGPFEGRVVSVSLDRDPTDTFNHRSEYKEYVKALGGIRPYRDGFGIAVDPDWLGLGEGWTSAASYYGLRPSNVIGYIDLSAGGNPQLVETTSREGFSRTAHYTNFRALLDAWRAYSEAVQTKLRRALVAYVSETRQVRANVPADETPTSLLDQVQDLTGRARGAAVTARAAHHDLRESSAQLSTLAQGVPATQRAALREVQQRIDEASRQLNASIENVESVTRSEHLIGVIQDQVRLLQSQLDETWAAVALGITAEALTHELHVIADKLRQRTADVERRLRRDGTPSPFLATYLEYVRSAAAAINRQLLHLDPSLRYMRERRQPIALAEFLAQQRDYYNERWSRAGLVVETKVDADFIVEMNLGKLTQVLDNLILNSEYWIRERQRREKTHRGRITLTVDRPLVMVEDNGPGIAKAVQHNLFEPFVSNKRGGTGRGLGLFVVRQLLDSEGCTIELLRTPTGRPRAFALDLTGAAADGVAP